MREFYKNYLKDNTFFWIFSIIGLLLIVIAFFVPPAAQIHQSVLIAVGGIKNAMMISSNPIPLKSQKNRFDCK